MLWKMTGEVRWHKRGYEIFQALERHSRTNFGYASVRGVDVSLSEKVNHMPWYSKFAFPLSLQVDRSFE
jgi:mannosyl-oligosaccharide alpha-1,2-mannosidase